MDIRFVIVILVALPHSGTLTTTNHYGKDFEMKLTSRYEYLTGNVSKILCSIDLKLISICFELNSKSEIVDDLLQKTLQCVPGASIEMIGRHPSQNHSIATNGSHLIIVILNDQRTSLSILQKMHSQRHRQYYIFIWDGEPPIEFQYFLHFIYWNYSILNAVTMVQKASETEHRVVTYNPFTKRNIRMATDVYTRNELFIEKDRNVFGYPMLITRYKSVLGKYKVLKGTKSLGLNLNSFVPRIVTDVMNATLILSEPYVNKIDLKQMANADLLVNSRVYSPLMSKQRYIEPTIAIKRDDICVLVPFKRFRPMLESIYLTLQPMVWICAMVASVVTLSLIVILKWEGHYLNTRNRAVRLNFFGNKLKLPGALAPRWIIMNWILYCVIITCVFQSALYQGVTKEGRDPQITTVVDLIKSKYEVLINDVYYRVAHENLKNSPIVGNFRIVDTKDFLDKVFSKNLDYAYIEIERRTTHFAKIIEDHTLPVYYTMRPCLHPQISTYYVRRGSPFLNRINWIIRQLQENGFFTYWERKLYNPNHKRAQLYHRANSGCLDNLYFIFEYWFFALLVCCLGFTVELIVTLFNKRS